MNLKLLETNIEEFNRWYNCVYQKGEILMEAEFDWEDKDIKVHVYKYLGNHKYKQIYIEPFNYCDYMNLTPIGIANRALKHALQMVVAGEE